MMNMLSKNEKDKVKDVLEEGLGIRRNLNLAYYLNAIDSTNENVEELQSQINQIIHNQRRLDDKLDRIIRMLMNR